MRRSSGPKEKPQTRMGGEVAVRHAARLPGAAPPLRGRKVTTSPCISPCGLLPLRGGRPPIPPSLSPTPTKNRRTKNGRNEEWSGRGHAQGRPPYHTRKSWNPWLERTAGASARPDRHITTHGPSARALCVRLAGDGCAQGRLGLLPATAHRRRVEEPHRPRANTAWAAEPAGVARCRVGSQTRTRVLARLSAIRMRALTDKQLGICRARTVTGSSEREGGRPMRCGRCV